MVKRGTITNPEPVPLSLKTYEIFEMFIEIPIVPFGQLYGSKICAALDRQHPRDLFDVKLLMNNEGFSNEVREGFLFSLICSNRPMNELLIPKFQDQHQSMENQFTDMSNIEFSYNDFEEIREQLVETINKGLTDRDKEFLLGVKNCDPDWSIYDFKRFPAVQWKQQNLLKLKERNPDKHIQLYEASRVILEE